MRLLDLAAVSIEPVPGAALPRSRLRLPAGAVEIDGSILEAAVALDAADPVAGWLLFLTDDVPDEDSLSITLVNARSQLLDRARLGGPYSTGTWRDPAVAASGVIDFDFIDGRRWTLTVLAAPVLRLPFAEPAGVRRPIGWRRHFVLAHVSDARRDTLAE